MNETDPDIEFHDELGCNRCIEMRNKKNKEWYESGHASNEWIDLVKKFSLIENKKGHGCILALSGGIDSCNLAYLVHSYGIKPLVLHVDTGWNSVLSYKNLKSIIDSTGWELQTVVINWEEMRELQIAYLKSGVSNLDVPQDHAIFASLYATARNLGHRYILTGGNMASEGIFPSKWHHSAMDRINMYAINNAFGKKKLSEFPTVGFLEYYFINPFLKGIRTIRPLNLLGYDKEELSERVKADWSITLYRGKHGESSFTSFFQNYILPLRYGIDKRVAHLSSLIISGNMNRQDALKEIEKEPYTPLEINLICDFIARRLQISTTELRSYINAPTRNHTDFANWNYKQAPVMRAKEVLSRILKRSLSKY